MSRTRSLLVFSLGVILLHSPEMFSQQEKAVPGALPPGALPLTGFKDPAQQLEWDRKFLAVPDASLAGAHLKVLTAAPHVASSPEDKATADYIAAKFRQAGLETEIVPYRVLLTFPISIHFDASGPNGFAESGPTREHVDGDPYQDDPRVLPGFNSSSASGDVTGEVVYANYGRPEDFKKLEELHIDVRGKIVLVRYGSNFRGVKALEAQEHGAAAVVIYSDPADDGFALGEMYPKGPYRPETGIQRGAVQYLFQYSGDVTTPGIASTPDLPDQKRTPLEQASAEPRIISTPISYHDAAPILERLAGPAVPHEWQGALPFSYHVGGGPVKIHLVVRQSYDLHTIWDVIGKIPGSTAPEEWVVAGNHRDAWVYGAADPNSGTASMLEAVHGLGVLLKQGWKPKRTLIFGSWDAEEQGLIGSTEWVEQNIDQMRHTVAYFNVDVAAVGPNFEASAVPSLKTFLRQISQEVPSPQGGSVFDHWGIAMKGAAKQTDLGYQKPLTGKEELAAVGNLGSGSDFTPFLQHAGVPSTDIGSEGPYGVYHSVFDNYQWFTRFGDPNFLYLQQQARFLGLEALHMADADVLPFDYAMYAQEIAKYIGIAKSKAAGRGLRVNFASAEASAEQLTVASANANVRLRNGSGDTHALNTALRQVESDLLAPEGLATRPWYKHTIFAPGVYTGYAAVLIPAITEAIDAGDAKRANAGVLQLGKALDRAAATLKFAAQTP